MNDFQPGRRRTSKAPIIGDSFHTRRQRRQAVSYAPQDFSAFQRKLNKRRNAAPRQKILRILLLALGAAVIIFAVIALLNGGEPDAPASLQETEQTAAADTSTSGESADLVTLVFSAAAKQAGFTPAMPEWLPDSWDLLQYECAATADCSSLTAIYRSLGNARLLRYEVRKYATEDALKKAYKEEAFGTIAATDDNRPVYLVEEASTTSAAWFADQYVYTMEGPFTSGELLIIINSIP